MHSIDSAQLLGDHVQQFGAVSITYASAYTP